MSISAAAKPTSQDHVMNIRVIALIGLALTSCAQAPEKNVLAPLTAPSQWTAEATVTSSTSAIADDWWTALGDAELSRIVAAAGDTSDVRIAQARLDEANAFLRGAQSALRPDVSLGAGGSINKSGDAPRRQESANAQLNLSWEIDLFGANGARVDSAISARDASALRITATRITARATAARLYFTQHEATRQRAIAEQTITSLIESLALARSREAAGLNSALDVAQAEAALASARAAQPRFAAAAVSAARGLEALLGQAPGSLSATLENSATATTLPSQPETNFPADVLARRPDLAASEKLLTAAGYNVSAARADFYPKLRIGASAGLQTLSPTSPFQDSGFIGSLLGSLTTPLFERGTLAANLDAASARQRIAAEGHRQALIDALSQVETAGNEFNSARVSAGFAAQAAAASERQLNLARSRYRAGVSSFLDVIIAEQSVFAARQSVTSAEADAARALAALYAAMGLGGLAT
jgi:NodT family efflux transporter outer membrane factor (OMF) lipoprotein